MRNRTATILATLACGLLLVSGCSSSSSDGGSATSTIPKSASFNSTDVGYAQGMIPHHAQAIEMARLVPDRSTNDDVRALAAAIEAAQGPEITELQGWLRDWGQKVPPADGDHDMSEYPAMTMTGMLSAADMRRLEGADGTEFDRLFLEFMVLHHEGAVEMAEDEVAGGKAPETVEQAERVIRDQTAEIAGIERILAGLPT
mgnify:CR=1 FL=1